MPIKSVYQNVFFFWIWFFCLLLAVIRNWFLSYSVTFELHLLDFCLLWFLDIVYVNVYVFFFFCFVSQYYFLLQVLCCFSTLCDIRLDCWIFANDFTAAWMHKTSVKFDGWVLFNAAGRSAKRPFVPVKKSVV